MQNEDEELLVTRYLDGDLSDEEKATFDRLVKQNATLARRVHEAKAIETLVAEAPTARFKPFFASRVVSRITAEQRSPSIEFADAIARLFPRIAAPAGAVAAFFMAGNVSAAAADVSFIEAVLGMPASTPDLSSLLFGEPL